GDMFTRSDMSRETREVMNSIVDDLYGNLVTRIAAARKKSPDEVRAIIDQGPFTAPSALKAGLVDTLMFEDQMWGDLSTKLTIGTPPKVPLQKYMKVPPDNVGLGGKSRIALVVGSGDIVRGDPNDDGSSETSLTSYGFDKMLNRVANDSNIKAVVV